MKPIKIKKEIHVDEYLDCEIFIEESDILEIISKNPFLLSTKKFLQMNKLEKKRFLCDLLNLPYQTPDKQLFRELYNETIN